MPEHVFRWGVLASSLPVVAFLVAIPVAFVSTVLAVAVWFLILPVEWVLDRRAPPDVADFF